MNNLTIISTKKEILAHLAKRQLKEAFDKLTNLAVNTQDWLISEKLSDMEANYKYLLHYRFEGVDDPESESVYNTILRSLYEHTEDVCDELMLIESTSFFFEKSRTIRQTRGGDIFDYQRQLITVSEKLSLLDFQQDEDRRLHSRDLLVKRERICSDFFMFVFVSPRATDVDYDAYRSFLEDMAISPNDKCLVISALTLNLNHRFDPRKLNLLMDACTLQSSLVSQRAIVGLIILLQMYAVRWNCYPECINRLKILSEDGHFRKSVLTIIKQLIRSRETEKISKRLNEEIIPEMMRFRSISGKKINFENFANETDFTDKNPEWEKELEKSGLADKLKEYTNLQMEGADVFHSTFSNLKNFPFFRDLSNWFLPFDTNYSELQGLASDKDGLLHTAILNSGQMCDSDKYSFALSLMQMPSTQREMLMGQFGAENEQLNELKRDAASLNPMIDEEAISNLYIQNLYRFFKLNPNKNNFFDIFQLKLNFYDKSSIAPLVSEEDSMKQIAHYCFHKNFFVEALDVYQRLALFCNEDSDTYQKIGYCKQILGDEQGALDAYLRADLIAPNNSWTIRHVAQMYRLLKQPNKALDYYQKAAQLNLNDLSLEMNIGHCYLDLKDHEKALNCYFKVEVLDPKNAKAWRPIAWTAFLLQKFEVSQHYYQQILNKNPTVHDYLNAGHVELCINNMKGALSFYKQAIRKEGDMARFISLFEEDKEELFKLAPNITDVDLPLLFDQLRYEIDLN